MGRTLTGSVEMRGTPPRWFARITVWNKDGTRSRVWHDLNLTNPRHRGMAKRAAARLSRLTVRPPEGARTLLARRALVESAIAGLSPEDAADLLVQVAADLVGEDRIDLVSEK